MRPVVPSLISLTEYQPVELSADALPLAAGELLWRYYNAQVEVEFPSPKTGGRWRLTAQGWVGHISLTPDIHLTLQPKLALSNLFQMIEVAYRLDVKLMDGLMHCTSLEAFFDRLAHILALKVLERSQQGLYRSYEPGRADLPFLRGRIDTANLARQPLQIALPSHYLQHTVDVDENRILAWTLHHLLCTGLCSEQSTPTVRKAYQLLKGVVTLQQYRAKDCAGRLYNRLNSDYGPLHAICHFFLAQHGPVHNLGDKAMLPFLVDMASLYEQFVAGWLSQNLPSDLRLKVQESLHIGGSNPLRFMIDLVLYDAASGLPKIVLDTKYKRTANPAHSDIFQAVTYAEGKGCRQAVLIYPLPLAAPLNETIGDIRLRSLTFAVDGNLDDAGHAFLQSLCTIS